MINAFQSFATEVVILIEKIKLRFLKRNGDINVKGSSPYHGIWLSKP